MTLLELVAVRHGESVANAAFARADAAGLVDAGVTGPDSAVGLTDLGRAQSVELGRWLAATGGPPDVVVSSPFVRAVETARLALAELARSTGRRLSAETDARLRDRDMGVLELMTAAGIRHRWPAEAEARERAGEADYRPPRGESMSDVAARVRSFLDDAQPAYGGRLLVVAHDSTVLMLRQAIEGLTVAEALTRGPVLNASPTRWVATPEGLRPPR